MEISPSHHDLFYIFLDSCFLFEALYSRRSLSRLPFISTFPFLDLFLSVPWAFQPPVGKNTLVNSTTRYLDFSLSRPSFAGPLGPFYHVISTFSVLFEIDSKCFYKHRKYMLSQTFKFFIGIPLLCA